MKNLGSIQESWRVENERGKEKHTWDIARETDIHSKKIEYKDNLICLSLSIKDQREDHGQFNMLC